MFVIELTYTAELSAIDAQMKAHVAFLKKHYAAGMLVMRRHSRIGIPTDVRFSPSYIIASPDNRSAGKLTTL